MFARPANRLVAAAFLAGGLVVSASARPRSVVAVRPAFGSFAAPVAGTVITSFGAAGADGAATGITYAAMPGAVVSAPCRGSVAFAEAFRTYGRLVILTCAGGADIVLSGLASIGARKGSVVRSGEALGRMPTAAGAELFMELRVGGLAVDPVPFLRGGT